MSTLIAFAGFGIILIGSVVQRNIESLDMDWWARRKHRWFQGLVIVGALVMIFASSMKH